MPASALKQRFQDNAETSEPGLALVKPTDSAAETCLRGLAHASRFQPVFIHTHQCAVDKLRVLCNDLIANKPILDAIEMPADEMHEFRDPAEQMLRAAGCAYAKAIAEAKIAKAQAEMMARVQAEQQAIAEKRASIVNEDAAPVVPEETLPTRPLRLVARRAADVILFRKRSSSRVLVTS